MRTKLESFLGYKEKLLQQQQTKHPALEKRQGRGTQQIKTKGRATCPLSRLILEKMSVRMSVDASGGALRPVVAGEPVIFVTV